MSGGREKHQRGDQGGAAADRLVAIDVLRAVAIIWVVLFHLWGDIKYFPAAPADYYDRLGDKLSGGAPLLEITTAFTDLLLRLGFQGVPLFMMLSGVSLTVTAYRGGDALRWPRFLWQRFRKLMVPYWFGVALTYGVMAAIAWRQDIVGGGPFTERFQHGVTISGLSVVAVDWDVVIASVALVPRLTGLSNFFAPQLALWFVGLLAQYYLLFPVLFFFMKRAGVVVFLAVTAAITVATNLWVVDQYGVPELKFWLVTGWAPFRMIEFTLGMAAGWLIASPERKSVLALARNPLVVISTIALGVVVHTWGGILIGDPTRGYWQAIALPLSTLGLAMIVMPLLVKPSSRVELTAPVRAIATLGMMSYAILIVNECMRLVASQVRIENPSDEVWWTFVVAVYVPVTVIIAWPVAHLLGLMPRRAPQPVRIAARELQDEPLRTLAPAPQIAAGPVPQPPLVATVRQRS
jgi:peptidoglycan/LPS O-acetylase OafA/YrhL